MNLDPLSFTLTQISNLVTTLSKKNYNQNTRELAQLVKRHGLEAERHLLRCLFSSVDFSEHTGAGKGSAQAQLLSSECGSLLNKPALVSSLCFALDYPFAIQKTLKPTPDLLRQITRTLSLTAIQEVILSLALRHSSNPDTANLAAAHLKLRLPDLIKSYIDSDTRSGQQEGGLHDTSPEALQLILTSIANGQNTQLGVTDITRDLFIKHLCRDFPRDRVPLILAPLLYPENTEISIDKMSTIEGNLLSSAMMDSSWAELIMEIGYGFTASVEDCRNTVMNIGGRELTPTDVAKIISMMAKTHTNLAEGLGLQTPGTFWPGSNTETQKEKSQNNTTELPTSWKPEIFIQALKELVPNLNWKDVCAQLDHNEFLIKDRQALSVLFTLLRLGLHSSGCHAFPVEYIYRHWINVEGQLSLITNILKNSDIFCFADHPFAAVQVDVLKSPPESENKEIATWRSLHLIELLLSIAESGFYPQVHELFKTPLQHCPDVLVLALLQINPPVSVFRQELLTNLMPIFLGNHPNSAIILHHAWHTQNIAIKPVIMHAMAEWYLRGEHDQSRLSRILDVAQDLKALSMLLNARSFMFVIDLACLASRREYLKLEKWLADKVREHGETFIAAIIKFLQRRCPQLIGGKISEDQIPKAAQLPHEAINTMLACLQGCIGNIPQDHTDAILTLTSGYSMALNNPRQGPPGVLRPHRALETPFNPSSLGGQLFNAPNVDSLASLNSNLANINLGAPGNSAFSMPAALGPLVPTPGSPSRLLGAGPSNSPFPLMPLQHSNAVGGGPSIVQGVTSISSLGRMGPTPGIDKPRIQETGPNLFPDMGQTVSKEVEDEANSYFQRIYNHPPHPTLSIDEVLDMLKKFQDAPVKREREVFNCMLRNLFEEYRFFPQYPDKELHITAQLFGGIVDRGLVSSYMALGMALRFVLDALRKPEGSKMYYFGIAALDRFKARLKDYHKYCEHVRAIPHFNEFPPHLIEYIEYGLQSLEPPNKPQGPVLPASLATILSSNTPGSAPYRTTTSTTPITTSTVVKATTNQSAPPSAMGSRPSIANATNIDTLLVATERDEKMVAPPEAIQDKTAFIFNNLSQLNLQTKCDEIRDILSEEYWPWISQYLVMKRASIELNFHALYSNFLDVLKIPEVNQIVTKETFRNIKVLLRSDKGIANFSDRSLLKNLGHWLGMLTLGRNKPILQIDIDVKSLLVEAYHKGQQELLYVVPFVAKVLESCAKSRVFKPPNPWTMAIMNVLAELHQEPDLKLNLKFEIEVLCKNLTIDVSELKPAIYLKDPDKIRNLEYQLSHPNKLKQDGANMQVSNPTPAPAQPPNVTNVLDESHHSATPSLNLSALDASTTSGNNAGPPEPRFSYTDITVNSPSCLEQHITVSPIIQLFQTHPHLKQYIRGCVERAIQEWIHPVVDRSIKIALTTSEQVVRKDFALDPDEMRMRTSAHHMVRNLAAGMAMITCRDQLMSSINTNLKTAFLNAMVTATPQQKDLAETAATQIAGDNMELACAFVQKRAIEKALAEIDKRLVNDYELRRLARNEGRRFCDTMALSYQAERMPEQIRLKVGGISATQMAVYDEFARNIPGFLPLSERDIGALFLPKSVPPESAPPLAPFPPQATAAQTQQQQNPQQLTYTGIDELGTLYDKLISDIEKFLNSPITMTLTLQANLTHSLLERLIIARRSRDLMSACSLLQQAVEGLLEGLTPMPESPEPMIRFRELHMRVLKLLQDPRAYGHQWTNKQVTRSLTECREDLRYNLDAVDCLIRSNLVNVPQYDIVLTQCMDNGNNYMAVSFAMSLIQQYMIDERVSTHVSEQDFFNTIESLARMSLHARQPPEGLTALIDLLRSSHDTNNFLADRAPGGPTSHIHSGILQVRAADDDPPGLVDKTDILLREWVQIYHTPQASRDPTKAFSIFVHQMNVHGILKTDDLITRFFRLSTQICVDVVYRNINDQSLTPTLLRAKCFSWLDAFVRLVSLLVKHSGDSGNTSTKINLLNKVLGIVAGCLLQDHESHGTAFQQLPYHRIFVMLFLELNAPEPVLEAINFQVLTAFCHTLHILRPTKAPGFCYAWLELISHRVFIGRMLAITPQQKGWGMYAQLLVDLFKYLAPFLRNAELAKPVTLLYKGTLRVLLVLLHDFPEFLCDYHYGFCDVIPPNCIQMRNLILSAFPRNMRLPDPFTPNLKVDMLSEISHAPRVLTNYATLIQPVTFKKDLDSYLKARSPVTFLSELRSNMQISNEPGLRYNIPLMNAVVLYVGTQAIAHIRNKGQTPNMSTIVHSAPMDIFQNLAVDLDNEGRYLFLNAIANQLRYPNSHTHYFSCALLYLFVEANTEAIQEQITRVLLERLIVNRPHPWGLLITFIELIKNPTYKFWDHDFVHCASEIEKLFESVARSCMVVKTPQPSVSDGELPE